MWIAVAVLALVTGALGGTYHLGHKAGSDKVTVEFTQYRLNQEQALSKIIEENRTIERSHAAKVAEIRLNYKGLITDAEKRAEMAVRDVNFANHRLQLAFDTCANSINVLADGESAARADAEGFSDLLGELHEQYVSEYARADAVAIQLNSLIDFVDAQEKGRE